MFRFNTLSHYLKPTTRISVPKDVDASLRSQSDLITRMVTPRTSKIRTQGKSAIVRMRLHVGKPTLANTENNIILDRFLINRDRHILRTN